MASIPVRCPPVTVCDTALGIAGALYRIYASGQSSLSSDQRRTLTGLRFISRVGPFPPANPSARTTAQQPRTAGPPPILAGVATDRSGHIYVADERTNRLFVLSPDLTLLAVWRVPRPSGPADVHLTGVAVDRHGRIQIGDMGTDSVHELSSTGHEMAILGTPGTGPGQFRGPNGIAIGARGNMFVADGYNHRV